MKRLLLALVGLGLLAACKGGNKYADMARQANAARDAGPEEVKPAPPGATLLAAHQNVPRDLRADDSSLYWWNEGGRWEGQPGLFRMPKGGGDPTCLRPGAGILATALDASALYWLEPEAGRVMRLGKSQTEPTVLATTDEAMRGMALDDTFVYWTENAAIHRVPKEGGKAQVVAKDISMPDMLSVDGTHVYWYSMMAGVIYRAPKKGGAPKKVHADDQHTLHAFFLDGDDLYFSYGAEKKMELLRIPKAGGKPTPVLGGQDPASAFAVSGDRIYWVTEEGIFSVGKSGGVSKVIDKTDRARDLVVEGRTIYWTDRGGRVQRMSP